MAKGKKNKQAKSKTVTLKMAQNCLELTLDGKRRLDLSYKEVATVPKCIQKLGEIDELDLSRNLIRKVPDFIEYFISIRVLDLHSNYAREPRHYITLYIFAFPEMLAPTSSIISIMVDSVIFSRDHCFDFQSIAKLCVGHKILEELPVTIGRLQSLLVLNLCNNRLTSLPSEIGLLSKLHTLRVGMNQLEALPSSIGALKELRHIGLSDNQFTRVPGCLSRLDKLEKVNLDRNPIMTEDSPGHESLMISEKLYLVKESFLCEDCLNKCQTERKKVEDGESRNEPNFDGSTQLGGSG